MSEVFPGSTTRGANAEFIELQLYADGQDVFMGNNVTLRIYNSAGFEVGNYPFGSGPAFGNDQRTILALTSQAATSFGLSAGEDLTLIGDSMNPVGGAVCFTSNPFGAVDCATWGAFTGTLLPPTTGGPPAVPGGIPDEQSIKRDISRGCPTLLEGSYPPVSGADDVNNSSVDFTASAPTPRTNATAPTETACAGGSAGGDTSTTAQPLTTIPTATTVTKCPKGKKLKKGKCVKKKKKKGKKKKK